MRLIGKTALITGGSSGIGLAAAKLMASEGARVAITGRDHARLQQAVSEIGGNALAIEADMRVASDLRDMAKRVKEEFGGLDILFANAGLALPTPLSQTDETVFDTIMETNVKGAFFTMQAAAPILRENASVILNSAYLNTVGIAGLSVLAASKASLRAFARSWSAELLDRRIRVNVVSPGVIDTPIFGRVVTEEVQAAKDYYAAKVPVGRMGTADDVAEAVVFLASDASRYMLGAEIAVDGGLAQI